MVVGGWLPTLGHEASGRSGQLWWGWMGQLRAQPFAKGILVANQPCSQETTSAGNTSCLSPFISVAPVGLNSFPNAG